jgi:hypothetical protein
MVKELIYVVADFQNDNISRSICDKLIPLCKLHHKMVHDGEIKIDGFVATSKGLELVLRKENE